jgi:hypothetical protein
MPLIKTSFSSLFAICCISAYAQIPQPTVAYSFDENPDSKVAKNHGASGAILDLKLKGDAKFTATSKGLSNKGSALDLSASEMGGTPKGSASSQKQSKITGLSQMTITGWIKIPANLENRVFLITCSSGDGNQINGWQLRSSRNNRLVFIVGEGTKKSDYYTYSQAFAKTDIWQFFAVSWHQDKGATWYMGTENSPPKPAGNKKAAQLMGKQEQSVQVGMFDEKTGAFGGFIDNIVIFDTALSNETIKEVYLKDKNP